SMICSLLRKYWYSVPTLTPARSATRLVVSFAYPSSTRIRAAASITASNVASARSCFGFRRSGSAIAPPADGTRARSERPVPASAPIGTQEVPVAQRATATMPGPQGLPMLGSLLQIQGDPLTWLTRMSREYGDISRFRVGVDEWVVVS